MVSDGTSTARPVSSSQSVDRRKVAAFLALAFGLSWITALALYLSGVEFGTLVWTVLLVAGFMWAPAIAAIVVQWRWGGPIRTACRLSRGRLRWVALAWAAPVALVALTIGVGTLFPGVSFTTDYGAYLLELGLTQEQVDQTVTQLNALPVPPAVLFVGQGLAAGLTVNALAALGEELGWRGLLLSELSPLGFWKLSLLTGTIWGVWHAPIIVQGYNFPDAPLAGVLVMTGATIAVSPVYTYLTVRADTVLAATFFHGTFNGLGGLSLIYLTGAGNLLVAPVGAAGIGAALLATALCVVHDRFVASERITAGAPLGR